ncbi:SDR family NAD(P)-dependent oxidoreductase [Rhizorhabdus wittichii]|uniref:SDR family NAD(P)-dependent oxidoreductase n=1 Tax=Rhizorhabdus wittichii TaxID=160791 RepID=A0A975HCF6_9SPHN|nr:SDR family NAD(P)-dependent oxidoreductase [Rhizorhabdus wittichii]QTH20203.1 SDR family NAD(P)-dependent oxidoreductase [Rhizorhabdus wittichii]
MQSSSRSAIVTGGARGLGEAYATLLAAQGYAVIVNDRDGEAAAETVEKIRAAGGSAFVSVHNVEDSGACGEIVAHAIARTGRIDAVIANAGYLNDRSFAKMTAEEFDAMIRVHLLGTAHLARAAWPHLAASTSGRLIFTTSSASLWGNFGQANYGAAKAGVVGLMLSIVEEGLRSGIRVNTIAPYAMTRLGDGIFDPALARHMSVQDVARIVTHLCSTECAISGELLELGAGRVSRAKLMRSEGILFGDDIDQGAIAVALDELMTQPLDRSYSSAGQSFAAHVAHLKLEA